MGGLSVWQGTFRIGVPLVHVLACTLAAEAIEVQPSRTQIEEALERGRAAAVARIPPDRLYAWFGTPNELEPRGFLMTKVVGLTVMAAHFALRSATPTESEIAQILEDRALLINVIIFGDRPNFAVDSYMVFEQRGRTVKPIKVRFDGQASRTSVWLQAPAYRAKVVASFPYAELDRRAEPIISVFPAGGGQVSFDLDFSRIE